MPQRNVSEQEYRACLDLVDSPSWRTFMLKGFLPIYKQHAKRALDPNTDDIKRKADVLTCRSLREGIVKVYANIGVVMPSWLIKEFDPFDEH